MRLQKFLADAGIASRRASEDVILEGRVKVNGQPVRTLGAKIDSERDQITVDGRLIKPKRKLYIALNKPVGFICSRSDPEKRPCASDLLPGEWREVYSVGRLDFDSEGLILFTNDGDFSLKLTHPRYGIQKIYHVTVRGKLEHSHARAMEKGIFHEGELLRARRARVLHAGAGGGLLEVVLIQGRNREVRRMCEAQGLKVDRLVRVQIGGLKLAELPRGKWRILNPAEVKGLLEWKDRPTKAEPEHAGAERAPSSGPDPIRPTPRPQIRTGGPRRDFDSRRPNQGWADRNRPGDRPARGRFDRNRPERVRLSEEPERAAWRPPPQDRPPLRRGPSDDRRSERPAARPDERRTGARPFQNRFEGPRGQQRRPESGRPVRSGPAKPRREDTRAEAAPDKKAPFWAKMAPGKRVKRVKPNRATPDQAPRQTPRESSRDQDSAPPWKRR